MRKRYLFFDIDGTLIPGGYSKEIRIPESTCRALEELRRQGHFLCIATGRSEAMARQYMEEAGLENMVCDGGYGFTIEGKYAGTSPLPKDKVLSLIAECETRSIPWAIQTDNSDTRLAPDERFEAIAQDIYQKTRVVPGLNPASYEHLYKTFVACHYPEELSLKMLEDLPWCRYTEGYVFVEPSAKGIGIHRMLEHFGGRAEDAVVFGDSRNDLSMFGEDGWIRVAMGNASPELKEKADLITTDVDKDGIWNACVRLGLIEEQR